MRCALIAVFYFLSFYGFPQIQINEIFADNGSCCLDESLESEDFLEIINIGPSPIDIAGYYFGDQDGGSIIPSGFPEITTLSSGEILLLWFDADPEQGPLHIDAKLNNDGENILAQDLNGNTIIDVTYGPQTEDVSFAAFPDGQPYSDGWALTMCPTPGEPNESCPLLEGCTSPNATNYNADATIENGSCVFGAFSGIVINEYSAANCDNDGSDCGDYEDWIELFNNTTEAIDLEGYYLSDKIDNLTKWQFPNSFSIAPGGYLIIYASGLDPNLEVSNDNTSFKLTQTRATEYIILSSPELEIVDYKKLEHHQLNHSVGRSFDASSNWSIFLDPTPGSANENEESYVGYIEAPYFNLDAGSYSDDIDLAIESNSYEIDIYYTLDGSAPTNNSTLYASVDAAGNTTYSNDEWISISETTVIRSIAYSSNPAFLPSFISTNTYFINEDHGVFVVSIAGGGELDDLLNGSQIRPVGSFEVFSPQGELLDEAVGEFNEHGNDSWAYPQRGFDYISRDQYGYNYAINNKLFSTKDRDSFQRLILKAAANDNYDFAPGNPAHIRDSYVHSLSQIGQLRMDERSHESCVLYVNGEYWGVYDIREKVDDLDFLDYYYDQPEGYVDFLKTWGNTWVEFGEEPETFNEWNTLRDFIVDNDMSDDANYEYVKSIYNTGSLIDYFILNSYVVCMDWLNWNTGWWRGRHPEGDKKKWRYILWDMDATFGHYINYTDIPETGPEADPCDPEGLGDPGGQGHVPILNSLLDNEDFMADYINRYADLSNTIFSCDFMISHLDSLIAIIQPEMFRQIERWGGNYLGWEQNVEELREFILERCSDQIVDGMEECYDVEAVDVTIIIEGDGSVEVNSIDLNTEDSPWTGLYYSGLPIELLASSSENSLFNFYWEVLDGDFLLLNPSDPNLTFNLNGPVTIVANFDACLSVQTEEIIGPTEVDGGSIAQYTFPSEFTNTSEWSVVGGEILFTSSTENTIAIQWNYGTGQGQIVLTQYSTQGVLECLFVNIEIEEVEQVGLDDSHVSLECLVFPNPANHTLNLISSAPLLKFSIYDMSGQLVYCRSKDLSYSGHLQIALPQLNSGIYMFLAESENDVIFDRIAIYQ